MTNTIFLIGLSTLATILWFGLSSLAMLGGLVA